MTRQLFQLEIFLGAHEKKVQICSYFKILRKNDECGLFLHYDKEPVKFRWSIAVHVAFENGS